MWNVILKIWLGNKLSYLTWLSRIYKDAKGVIETKFSQLKRTSDQHTVGPFILIVYIQQNTEDVQY